MRSHVPDWFVICVLHPMESKVPLRCSSKENTLAPLVSVSVSCVVSVATQNTARLYHRVATATSRYAAICSRVRPSWSQSRRYVVPQTEVCELQPSCL